MPVYCFTDKRGVTVERFMQPPAPQFVMVDGRKYERDFAAENAGRTFLGDLWPQTSDSLGCNPKQRKQYARAAAEAGIPTEYNELGQAVLHSRDHRQRLMKFAGLQDFGGCDGGWA